MFVPTISNDFYCNAPDGEFPLGGAAHQAGTVRFGHEPQAVNPSLTTIANALRVGDHLLGRMHA